MLRRLLSRSPISPTAPLRHPPRLLRLETLEAREVPSVTLGTISQPTIPNDKPIFIPVNVTNTPDGAVTTTVSSSNPDLAASIVQGGQSVRFDVSGTDSNGIPFTGSITVRLFTDSSPDAVQRIIDLVNSGFYVGKNFPRVLNNFMIQGGGTTTSDNSSLPSFNDQFNADFTFDSPGILAMANSGNDTNNSQFFITDPKDLLAQRATNLNFRYTIVGILTDGFDTYQKIITTTVKDNGSGEVSSPTNPITITGATVFTDTSNAVIELKPDASFGTGSATISVTASDSSGPTMQTFSVAGVNDGVDSPPFITTPIPDQTTTTGTPVTFHVPITDISNDPTTIAVKDSTFSTTTIANATVTVDQINDSVTITPAAGFTGQIQFKVGVRETSATDTAASYDTQLVTLTVNAAGSTTTPTSGAFTAQGSAPGSLPTVSAINSDGSVRWTQTVFDPSFTGGVRVAVGDVNDDGKQDVVAVPGFGGSSVIFVLDGQTGNIIRTVTIFADTYRGGLSLAVGDALGLGYDQVLVGAGDSGGPRVSLLDFKQSKELMDFYAGDPSSRGGVGSLAISTIFKNFGPDIVAGSGVNDPPKVFIFQASGENLIGSFDAGDPNNQTGIQMQITAPNNQNGDESILIAAAVAPPGINMQQYDPWQYMDPNNPVGSASLGVDVNDPNSASDSLNGLNLGSL